MVPMKERRHFIRHPVCYPLEFEYAPKNIRERSYTTNISEGGLLFLSKHHVHCGKIIILKIPIQNKLFKVRARVIHVRQNIENPNLTVGILKAEEGRFENNKWKVIRHLNGDQTHQGRHIRILLADGFLIQRFELYNYE